MSRVTDANGVDLSQLERWYSQAGTPEVTVEQKYDSAAQRFTLKLSQHTPSTPNQPLESKQPQLIPVVVGLLDATTGAEVLPSTVLQFSQAVQEFTFDNIAARPVLSALRDFSAPVKLQLEQTDDELCFLMAHDTDSFNRWDAGNRYFTKLILQLADLPLDAIQTAEVPPSLVTAVRTVLGSVGSADPSLLAYALQLPDEATLLNQMKVINIDSLHTARGQVKRALASLLQEDFQRVYDISSQGLSSEYQFTPAEVGRRRLQNTCLEYLTAVGDQPAIARAKQQLDAATCMTDKLCALSCLVSHQCAETEEALQTFHKDAAGASLVLNKWFTIQATANHAGVVSKVKQLKMHPDFTLSNPNRARSLIGAFSANLYYFHSADGTGYEFVADSIIEIDKLNPQVAARMVTAFAPWRTFDESRRGLMEAQLRRILAQEKLSRDTFENTQRCLK